MKNDDHRGKSREGSEEFNIVDVCETGEGEVFQGEDGGQVRCHWEEEVED